MSCTGLNEIVLGNLFAFVTQKSLGFFFLFVQNVSSFFLFLYQLSKLFDTACFVCSLGKLLREMVKYIRETLVRWGGTGNV